LEGWVVFLKGDVHVFEGGGRGGGRSDGEAEAVGLIVVVVWILAEDDGFDGVEGCVFGPEKSISWQVQMADGIWETDQE
jgi:hypothetical protein